MQSWRHVAPLFTILCLAAVAISWSIDRHLLRLYRHPQLRFTMFYIIKSYSWNPTRSESENIASLPIPSSSSSSCHSIALQYAVIPRPSWTKLIPRIDPQQHNKCDDNHTSFCVAGLDVYQTELQTDDARTLRRCEHTEGINIYVRHCTVGTSLLSHFSNLISWWVGGPRQVSQWMTTARPIKFPSAAHPFRISVSPTHTIA